MIGKTRNSEKEKAIQAIKTLSENAGKTEILEIQKELYKQLGEVGSDEDIAGMVVSFSKAINSISKDGLTIKLKVNK